MKNAFHTFRRTKYSVCISGAAPTRREKLRENFIKLENQTAFLIRRDSFEIIADSGRIDPDEVSTLQGFIDRWGSRNRNWMKDEVLFGEFEKEYHDLTSKISFDEMAKRLDPQLMDRISRFQGRIQHLTNRLAQFEASATEMIRVAKEAGYVDDLLENTIVNF